MNKIAKTLTCALLGGAMMFSVACKPRDNSDRALSLASGALDGNFNPYFYTSLTDGQVISQTQAQLISVTTDPARNNAAKAVAGDDYPCVAKDFKITYYDSQAAGTGSVIQTSSGAERTEYEFLIKNGMKFSDGEPLTIKDVLFNFYVYLDPSYIGSNTMYSVDIQGLTAYEGNNADLDDGAAQDDTPRQNANQRMNRLKEYSQSIKDSLWNDEWYNGNSDEAKESRADIERMKNLFKTETVTDWNSVETSWREDYEKEYNFKHAWEAYLFRENVVVVQERKMDDGSICEIRVDEEGNEIDPANKEAYQKGKKLTTLDEWSPNALGGRSGIIERQAEIDAINQIASDEAVRKYIEDNNISMENAEEYAYNKLTMSYCTNRIYEEYTNDKSGWYKILSWWATGTDMFNYFVADERSKIIENSTNPRNYISGIQTEKVRTFNGVDLGEEHDVLKVIVNKVDPAAIWQFGVTIAPLHYYSGKYGDRDYVAEFNGDQNNGKGAGTDGSKACFGVKRGDPNFFEEVVKAPSKTTVPVGAGPYMASTSRGGVAHSNTDFYDLNIVYYERNPYFETMGAGINNAKIKYLRYKVIDEQRIISSIEQGEVDYGEPSATNTNSNTINSKPTLSKVNYPTNGYGYVGVNPTYVPDINIRRIIMRAMDPSASLRYYGQDLAQVIYRPMSSESWAYPKGVRAYYGDTEANNPEYYRFSDSKQIKDALDDLGYVEGTDGVRSIPGKSNSRLEYTFTISGAVAGDHPAYQMFNSAAALLNDAGFKITVTSSSEALKKLTLGQLEVWAAAWSSGVDPDMYQVYHKDSQATSILNWGYKTIADNPSDYPEETELIDELSAKIMEARTMIEEQLRKPIYAECLDLIMELAVEFPVYQRNDLCVYNNTVLDRNTLNNNANATNGLLDRIWEVDYIK